MRNKTLFASLALALFAVAGTASADDLTGDINISTSIANTCEFYTTDLGGADSNPLSSGGYGYSPAAMLVRCNQGAAYTIVPGEGLNYAQANDRPMFRAMSDGAGHYIPYSFFQDSMATVPWDQGADAIEGVGNGLTQEIPLSYQFYDLNLAVAGSYSDTVTVTLTY